MFRKTDVVQIAAAAKYAPKTRYNVYYKEGEEWKNSDDLGLGRDFHSLDDAKSTLNLIEWERGPVGTMLSRQETVYFSDLQTKQPMSLTEWSVLLV